MFPGTHFPPPLLSAWPPPTARYTWSPLSLPGFPGPRPALRYCVIQVFPTLCPGQAPSNSVMTATMMITKMEMLPPPRISDMLGSVLTVLQVPGGVHYRQPFLSSYDSGTVRSPVSQTKRLRLLKHTPSAWYSWVTVQHLAHPPQQWSKCLIAERLPWTGASWPGTRGLRTSWILQQ